MEDLRIYVAFDDSEGLDRRMATAGILYDLSPTQVRVATEIALGHDLPAVAERMGISHHTVRTHLRRMFDKTGTGAQTALLRLLLSAGG